MGQHTLLRTLTRKSTLKFGVYYEYTVDQVLALKEYSYLRWFYYNAANITYTIDILEELNIEDKQIDKPGKCPKTGKAVQEFINQFIPYKIKQHRDKRNKQIAKSNLANLNKMEYNFKSYLQGKNHGR